MSYKDFDAFRASDCCRKASKKKRMHLTLTSDNMAPPENFYSDRRKGTSAVARVIFIIVLLHVLIVGGTCLHKRLQADQEPQADSSLTPPPSSTVAAEPASITPLPQPKAEVAQVASSNTITPPTLPVLPSKTPTLPAANTAAPADMHITAQAPVASNEIVAVEVPAAQPEVKAAPAPAPTVKRTVAYTIVSGDTWYGIAKKNKITVAQLQAANPVDTKKGTIYPGKKLAIPVYGDGPVAADTAAKAPATAKPAKPVTKSAAKVYVVASGDTLYRIAQKTKVSQATILQLNKIDKKDANKIKIGQKLILSK